MSGGGKKFNIWIVYSDLFTNLSTFLFIAALGVFAALGSSNHRPGPREAEPARPCAIPTQIENSLTEVSLLKPMQEGQASGAVCERYYQLEGYGYSTSGNADWSLRSDGRIDGQPLKTIDLQTRVCSPIWRAIGQQAFKDLDGSIVIHGLAREGGLWPDQDRCAPVSKPPLIDLLGPRYQVLGGAMRAIKDINQCLKKDPRNYAGSICDLIAPCDLDRPVEGPCRQAAALRDWDLAETDACLHGKAEQQAAAVAGVCEAWVGNKTRFPTGNFDEPTMSAIARFDGTRPLLWRRVTSDGFGKDAPVTASSDARIAILSRPDPGAIVVELRLRRVATAPVAPPKR